MRNIIAGILFSSILGTVCFIGVSTTAWIGTCGIEQIAESEHYDFAITYWRDASKQCLGVTFLGLAFFPYLCALGAIYGSIDIKD